MRQSLQFSLSPSLTHRRLYYSHAPFKSFSRGTINLHVCHLPSVCFVFGVLHSVFSLTEIS